MFGLTLLVPAMPAAVDSAEISASGSRRSEFEDLPIGALAHVQWLYSNGGTKFVTGEEWKTAPEDRHQSVVRLALSPGGDKVALTNDSVDCWCFSLQKRLFNFMGPHLHTVVAFAPDGHLLAVGSRHGYSSLHDAATGKGAYQLGKYSDSIVLYVAFASDGRRMVEATTAGIDVWDLSEQRRDAPHLDYRSLSDVFTSNAKLLASYDKGAKAVRVWDFENGLRPGAVLTGQPPTIKALALSPDGKTLVVGHCNTQGTICFWDLPSGRERLRTRIVPGADSFEDTKEDRLARAGIIWTSYAPDASVVATGSNDGVVRLWDPTTGKEVGRFSGHTAAIRCMAFTPDGQALASGDSEGGVFIWDPRLRVINGVPRPLPIGRSDIDRCWDQLKTTGKTMALYRAAWSLVSVPELTIPLLRTSLRPLPGDDPQSIAGLITDLGSDRFQTRDRASKRLGELAELAEPQLQAALAQAGSPEARRRADELLKGMRPSPDVQRQRWGVQILKCIGTPDATNLLKSLVKEHPGTWLAREVEARTK
jgi:hypothetical protein